LRATNAIVVFGFAILLPLLSYSGVGTIMQAPQLSEFVELVPYNPKLTTEERVALNEKQAPGRAAFAAATNQFGTKFISIATVLGAVEIIAGAYIGLRGMGAGLALAGILTILGGNLGYWGYVSPGQHFASLLIGFLSVFLVGYRQTKQAAEIHKAP